MVKLKVCSYTVTYKVLVCLPFILMFTYNLTIFIFHSKDKSLLNYTSSIL